MRQKVWKYKPLGNKEDEFLFRDNEFQAPLIVQVQVSRTH